MENSFIEHDLSVVNSFNEAFAREHNISCLQYDPSTEAFNGVRTVFAGLEIEEHHGDTWLRRPRYNLLSAEERRTIMFDHESGIEIAYGDGTILNASDALQVLIALAVGPTPALFFGNSFVVPKHATDSLTYVMRIVYHRRRPGSNDVLNRVPSVFDTGELKLVLA
jgi:hypothetical protein